jgi:hypothetical protein
VPSVPPSVGILFSESHFLLRRRKRREREGGREEGRKEK